MLARMWRKGSPHMVVGNVNWYSHYGKNTEELLKTPKINLPKDPEISILCISPKDITISYRSTVFVTVLLTVAKIAHQSR